MYYAWINTQDDPLADGESISVRLKRRTLSGSHEYYDISTQQWTSTDTVPLTPLKPSVVNDERSAWCDWLDFPNVTEPTALDYIHPTRGLILSDVAIRVQKPQPRAITTIF